MNFPDVFFSDVSKDLPKIQRWGATPKSGDMLLSVDEFSTFSEYEGQRTGVFEWSITNGDCLGHSWGLKVFLVRNGSVIETPRYTIRVTKGIFSGWKANFTSKE